MDKNKLILILLGIGIILLFLTNYLGSKSLLDLFGITLGVMIIISGFYTECKKIKVSISYVMAMFSVNIAQWLFLTNIYYHYPVYVTGKFCLNVIIALLITLFLINQIRKKYLKSSETTINVFKNKTRIILLFTGTIIIMGSLAGLITYLAPIFLYVITLGAMILVYGYYYDIKKVDVSKRHDMANTLTKKVNVTWNYIKAMSTLLILQFFIQCVFWWQMRYDLSITLTLWFIILIFF